MDAADGAVGATSAAGAAGAGAGAEAVGVAGAVGATGAAGAAGATGAGARRGRELSRGLCDAGAGVREGEGVALASHVFHDCACGGASPNRQPRPGEAAPSSKMSDTGGGLGLRFLSAAISAAVGVGGDDDDGGEEGAAEDVGFGAGAAAASSAAAAWAAPAAAISSEDSLPASRSSSTHLTAFRRAWARHSAAVHWDAGLEDGGGGPGAASAACASMLALFRAASHG